MGLVPHMGLENDVTREIEGIARELGMEGLKCRLMYRPADIDETGYEWPAYEEYEARFNGGYWTWDTATIEQRDWQEIVQWTLERP